MQNTTHHPGTAFPTGSLLARERQRLGKTQSEVAKAVHGHRATVQAIEEHNRAIPPGWYPALRALGVQIQEPVWPAQMSPYSGADLNRDLRTCVGFKHSRFRLSKMLCLPESAVVDVVRGNLPVPPSWLLKLAELGANVPAQVQMALHASAGGSEVQGTVLTQPRRLDPSQEKPSEADAAPNRAANPHLRLGSTRLSDVSNTGEPRLVHAQAERAPGDPVLRTGEGKGASLGSGSQPARSAIPPNTNRAAAAEHTAPCRPMAAAAALRAPSSQKERASFYFHWTEDGGLHFSVSTSLLNQLPAAFQELLIQLQACGLLGPSSGPGVHPPST